MILRSGRKLTNMAEVNTNNSDLSGNQEVVLIGTTPQNAADSSPIRTTNTGGSMAAILVSSPTNVRSSFNPLRPPFHGMMPPPGFNPQFGMPTSTMQGLHTNPSLYSDSMMATSTSNLGGRPIGIRYNHRALPSLSTTSILSIRQQIDESNHEMVNALTQQMGTVFTPMINNTNQSYVILAGQMARIAYFFRAPPQPNLSTTQGSNVRGVEPTGHGVEPTRHGDQIGQEIPRVVQRHQDADQVLRNIQQDVNIGHNNISNVVEQILVQNGINVGLHRPNFVSPLSEYVRQTELPRGWKVPKFTKFAGETGELTVEHIARFQTEAGEIANNENLKMKYFPSSLTKNAFTWFTTLSPQSLLSWNQLERLFHEQFYMGQSKISLKELAEFRRKGTKPVDDYLNRFRLLKARCFTQIPKHELVEMAAGGLDYSIRKKLDTQHLRDMAQLADRVRQVEMLKAEKARASKYHKKEKIAYVTTSEFDSNRDDEYEEGEVNVAELKPGPPYICKLLKPSKDKNLVESKNEKFSSKTYSFDITKCDEIFDLLVSDGQIIFPPGLKNPPLEQKKKRGFCKFHNFLGHKTSQCVLFRDLVQKALKEGRLQFGEKPKSSMQVDTDPLQVEEAHYTELADVMMVETTDGFVRKQNGATDGKVLNMVYPEPKESLLKFLERCHNNNSQVGLRPRCYAFFNVDAANKVRFDPRRGKNRQFMYTGENSGRRAGEYRKMFEKPRTSRPKTDVPETNG